MVEVAALGVKATMDGVAETTDGLKKLTDAAGGAEKATDKLRDSSGRFVKAGNDAAGAAGRAAEGTTKLGGAARTTDGALARLASRAGTVVGALTAMAASALSVGAYIRMADSWSDMRSQLGAAIGDMSAAGTMMQRMTDIANASYAPLDQTVQVYARNVGVLRDLGKSADDAADFTESLNHMLVITATKGERAASVQDALSKAMAVGVLQADGLETVLANGGRVAQALADELGTTVSGLRALATEGKITGRVIADSIIKPLEDVRVVAGEMPATVADGFTRIATGATALIGTFDQAFGISGALAGVLVQIGDGLASLAQSDFASWGASVTGVLTDLAHITLILTATRLPALLTAIYAQATAFSVATLAVRAYTVAGRGLAAVMALMGGPLGIAAAGATAFGLAIYNTRRDGEGLAETLRGITTAQEGLNAATETYYRDLSQQALDAMTLQAEAALEAVRGALSAAQQEFESASFTTNFFGVSLGETDRMAAARAEVQILSVQLLEAEARMSAVEHAASNFELRAREGTAAVVALTSEQQKALDSANELTRSYQNRADLARIESQYGKDSAQYLSEQINQERQIAFAKIQALDITDQQRAAARKAYDQMVMTEAKTQGWTVKLVDANTQLSSAYQALVKIRDTQPGSGWLSTAISKAAGLAATLWDAVAANGALSGLSVSGPVVDNGADDRGSQGRIRGEVGAMRSREAVQERLRVMGDASGAGSGGGGLSERQTGLEGLVSELQTERELLTVWYEEKLELIQSYSDRELEAIGGRHGALERLEKEHQERLRALGSEQQNQRLQDAAGFFGGMADLARSGGERTLKVAQGLAATQGLINSYLAFTEVLKDPAFIGRPWARAGAAAAALSQGLAAVRAIKGASSGGGGGAAPAGGANGGGAQSGPPEAPLRATLDAIDPGAIYSGAAMIKMFEAIQKEAGNRGIIWVPNGGGA